MTKTYSIYSTQLPGLCVYPSPHHKYSPVAVSVDAPQLDIGLSSNCGRSWSAVYQGQLAEAASFPNTGHPLIVHIHLRAAEQCEM